MTEHEALPVGTSGRNGPDGSLTPLANGDGRVSDSAASLYLDLLKRCVANLIYQDPGVPQLGEDEDRVLLAPFSLDKRLTGKDWPSQGHTMIGVARLDNIQVLAERILKDGIPGDFIETGVWRGGSTIFMRGLLKVHGVTDRTVWAADSFGAGFPKTAEQGASPRSYTTGGLEFLREDESLWPSGIQAKWSVVLEGTRLEDVRQRFARYGLLDDQVRFLPGWFHETLPTAPIRELALLRLDGDVYDSTHDALEALYPKLSTGGYAIVDDYGTFAECRQAVHDYLDENAVEADIIPIDDDAVYWRKQS